MHPPDASLCYLKQLLIIHEMSVRRDQNIFTVIFPFYVVVKLFGMFPLSFDGEPRFGVFKVKWCDKILSLIALVIMVGVTIMHSCNRIKMTHDSELLIKGWQIR